MLIEKALAKRKGSYKQLEDIGVATWLEELTGGVVSY